MAQKTTARKKTATRKAAPGKPAPRKAAPKKPFLTDVTELRRRARTHMESGNVTSTYEGNAQQTIEILQSVLATEIVCVLRYTMHAIAATGISSEGVKAEFAEHAKDEQEHAEAVAERINQLGGVPNFDPEGITSRAFSSFKSGHTLADLLREDLVAERVVIKIYSDVVTFFGSADPVSRRLFEELLQDEEDHADDIADLLYTVDPESGKVVEQFSGDSTIRAKRGS